MKKGPPTKCLIALLILGTNDKQIKIPVIIKLNIRIPYVLIIKPFLT